MQAGQYKRLTCQAVSSRKKPWWIPGRCESAGPFLFSEDGYRAGPCAVPCTLTPRPHSPKPKVPYKSTVEQPDTFKSVV